MNAAEGIQGQKIGVTCNNMSRAACYGEFQKLIILWVPADGDAF